MSSRTGVGAQERPALLPDEDRAPDLAAVEIDTPTVAESKEHAGAPPARMRALILLNVFAASLYLAWWLVPGRIGTPALFWALAGAEAFSFLHLSGLWWTIWSTKDITTPSRRTTFSVDVLITTYGEPLEILARTVKAAVGMRHPHRTIVLDDANDPRVADLAARLGAEYMAREENVGAKAGNLNNALQHVESDLIAVFDADHVPRRDFIVRLLGYFTDPKIAFVQTPQYYRNAIDRPVARGALDQQSIFYGPICRGKNGLNAAFCCGTNVLFRREALEDVGGFDERSVVEDLVTSMRMHRRGWRSVYHPYVLAAGLGPDTVGAYMRQQFRWARGAIGALMSGEPFRRGYTLKQRAQYLLATSFYLSGFATAVYVSLPFLYAFGGWSAFSERSSSFVFFFAPYLMLSMATIRWGLGKDLQFKHLRYTFGSFPVYIAAGFAAIFRLRTRFTVTGRAGRRGVSLAAIVTLVAFIVNVVALVAALILQPFDPRTVTTMSWAVMNIILLSGIALQTARALTPARLRASVGEPEVRPEVMAGVPRLPDRIRAIAPTPPNPSRRRIRATLAFVTLGGLALRVAFVGSQSLRLDESLSYTQAGRGLVDLWNYLLTSNVHVPLYHSILHFWVGIAGGTEVALRIPSVVFGTAAIPLFYAVTRRIAGPRTALVAAALGAASPFWIWHSDEARMYPLVLVVGLTSTLLFLRAIERPSALRWIVYGLATGVALYAHYFVALIPVIHLTYLAIYRVRLRVVGAAIGGMAIAGAMFAPWVWGLWTSRLSQEGITSLTNNIRLAAPEYSFFGLLYGMVAFFGVFFVGYHGATVLTYITGALGGMWPIAMLRASARPAPEPGARRAVGFLVMWIVLAVGTAFALNTIMPGLLAQKYLILASPPLFMLLARILQRGRGAEPRRVAIVFAVFASVAILQNAQPLNPLREDFRSAAAYVQTHGTPGETVFVYPRYNRVPLEYYHEPTSITALVGPDQNPTAAVGVIEGFVNEHRGGTFWTVSIYEETADPNGIVRRYLTRSFDRLVTYEIGEKMRLSRYRIPSVT